MSSELYRKLVDVYAERELPLELEDQMEMAAFNDPELAHEMSTLRKTVDLLHRHRGADFTEETYQRILMKLYARGAEIEPKAKTPAHLQYQLPIQG